MELQRADTVSYKKKKIKGINSANPFTRIRSIFSIIIDRIKEGKTTIVLGEIRPGEREEESLQVLKDKKKEFIISQLYMVLMLMIDIVVNLTIMFLFASFLWDILEMVANPVVVQNVSKSKILLGMVDGGSLLSDPLIPAMEGFAKLITGIKEFSNIPEEIFSIIAPLVMILIVSFFGGILLKSIKNNVINLIDF